MHELQQPEFMSPDPIASDTGPIVETARLRLRRHRLSDLEARLPITADPDFMRFVGGVYDRQENWARLLRYIGHWTAFGYGLFAVEEKASGAYIGDVGLARFERGLGEDFDPAPEGAWMIARSGMGYASEGMQAAIDWHMRTFGPTRTVCIVDAANDASLRVAEKLGFKPYREGLNRGHPVLLHERIPPLPLHAD